MDAVNIRNHRELKQHLRFLKSEREKRGAVLAGNVKDIYEVISHPAKIIKQTARELAGDNDFRSDLIKIAINLASNFLTKNVTSSAVSALLTLLIDKVVDRKGSGESISIFKQLFDLIRGKKSGQKKTKEAEL